MDRRWPPPAQTPKGGLPDYGVAPPLHADGAWINTKPLTLAKLRGKVVLVDFWTYSCINCLRTLPHLKAWYAAYHRKGLVIIGVHTPEFAFEHVTSNVQAAVKRLGINYPVVQDNKYRTWDNYSNQYWPAEYLIDKQGHVRHTHFGEGEYPQTEALIRQAARRQRSPRTTGRRRDADGPAHPRELPRLRAPRRTTSARGRCRTPTTPTTSRRRSRRTRSRTTGVGA